VLQATRVNLLPTMEAEITAAVSMSGRAALQAHTIKDTRGRVIKISEPPGPWGLPGLLEC
jgi:hypothetical protein